MIFDGALAYAKIRGDVLARMPGKNHVHDLMLPAGKTSDVMSCVFTPGHQLAGITRLLQCALNTRE